MRLWIGIFAVGALLVAALIGAGFSTSVAAHVDSSSAPAAPQSSSPAKNYDGIVTDTHCGAKHSAALGESAGDCTRLCVHSGEKFALVDGDQMYVLEGSEPALKHAAGERVRILGTLNGNTIAVVSIRPPGS